MPDPCSSADLFMIKHHFRQHVTSFQNIGLKEVTFPGCRRCTSISQLGWACPKYNMKWLISQGKPQGSQQAAKQPFSLCFAFCLWPELTGTFKMKPSLYSIHHGAATVPRPPPAPSPALCLEWGKTTGRCSLFVQALWKCDSNSSAHVIMEQVPTDVQSFHKTVV